MFFNHYTLFLLVASMSLSFGATYLDRNDGPLSSKVIFQSPMMENVYKEFVLSSKPINLKKYATAKPKHSQKDSKIYYIPIGPMPYHFAPGSGQDSQQPMQINPLVKVSKPPVPQTNPIKNVPNIPPNLLQAFLQNFQQNPQKFVQNHPQTQQQQNTQQNVPQNYQPSYTPIVQPNRPQIVPQNVPQNSATPNLLLTPAVGLANTKMTRLNGHSYYFNGRPYILQAYRAAPKLNVDKNNLQSHLFFNKNIIY